MDRDHYILIGGWILFGLLHSLLAAEWFKHYIRAWVGGRYRYYRFVYSVLALISLAGVVGWQLSVKSVYLPIPRVARLLVGIPCGMAGLSVMGACIRKYFYNLSGVRAFMKRGAGPFAEEIAESGEDVPLETGGMHRYIRHPLYLGTLLFVWALFLLFPLLSNLLACVIITLYTLIGIRLEERKLLRLFGEEYAIYRKRVPMLIPWTRRKTAKDERPCGDGKLERGAGSSGVNSPFR